MIYGGRISVIMMVGGISDNFRQLLVSQQSIIYIGGAGERKMTEKHKLNKILSNKKKI